MVSQESSPPVELKFQTLSATYTSPTNESFTHEHKIPTPPTSKTIDRIAYLAALREATTEMQEAINKDLTARMEEDKAREGAINGVKQGVDETKEEDNYGEEVAEED
jgi:hypothetical protein